MKIDTEFLEKVLQQPVSTFETGEGAKPGDNVAGSLTKVTVTLKSRDTLDLVVKTYSDDPEFKDYALKFGLFTTENTLYQTVVPRVSSLLKMKGIANPELPVPKFYGGNGDATQGPEYLCMEDVRPLGYFMQDKFKAYDLEETTLVLKEIARFHATTYYWIKQEGERIFSDDKGLTRLRDSAFSGDDPMLLTMGMEMFPLEVNNAAKVVENAGHKDLADKIRKKILDQGKKYIYDLFMERSKMTDKSAFPCIIHGDLWVNNVLIKYDSKGVPESLKFVDFQQTRRGNVYEDLIYFILTSTTPAFRKKHLLQVLNSYYESFAGTLDTLKCPLPLGFSRGCLIDTFYKCLFGGYVYMCFAIPMQLADPVDHVAKAEAMMKSSQLDGPPPDPSKLTPEQMMEMMVKGLEARSLMFYAQMIKSPRAIERLVDISKECDEMKLL